MYFIEEVFFLGIEVIVMLLCLGCIVVCFEIDFVCCFVVEGDVWFIKIEFVFV